jgi:hypothetical protein
MSVVYISALNNNTIQKYNLRSLDGGKVSPRSTAAQM